MQDAETVVWTPATTITDDYGNVDTTPGTPVSVSALVAARSSNENASQNAPGVLVGLSLYILDPSVQPGASDAFLVRGKTYQVVGESHRWGSSGVEVAVQRTGATP